MVSVQNFVTRHSKVLIGAACFGAGLLAAKGGDWVFSKGKQLLANRKGRDEALPTTDTPESAENTADTPASQQAAAAGWTRQPARGWRSTETPDGAATDDGQPSTGGGQAQEGSRQTRRRSGGRSTRTGGDKETPEPPAAAAGD